MKVPEAATITKLIQDEFQDCKITITTTGPDPAKNLENAKLFGKAGVKGKWVHKEEK